MSTKDCIQIERLLVSEIAQKIVCSEALFCLKSVFLVLANHVCPVSLKEEQLQSSSNHNKGNTREWECCDKADS